jgi:hypothetical protein
MLQQKLYTKAYHIIYSLYRSTYVESHKIGFSILWFFYLLWFFKDSAEINKKEKTNPPSKLLITGPGIRLPSFLRGSLQLARSVQNLLKIAALGYV